MLQKKKKYIYKNNGPPTCVKWIKEYILSLTHTLVTPARSRSLSSLLNVSWCLAQKSQVKKISWDDKSREFLLSTEEPWANTNLRPPAPIKILWGLPRVPRVKTDYDKLPGYAHSNTQAPASLIYQKIAITHVVSSLSPTTLCSHKS